MHLRAINRALGSCPSIDYRILTLWAPMSLDQRPIGDPSCITSSRLGRIHRKRLRNAHVHLTAADITVNVEVSHTYARVRGVGDLRGPWLLTIRRARVAHLL